MSGTVRAARDRQGAPVHREPRPVGPRPSQPTALAVYGCSRVESSLFRALGPRFGVLPRTMGWAVSEASADAARGCRFVSVDHRTRLDRRTLRALARVGVEHISTRSVGSDHIDVDHAAALGMTVRTVAYSPDSVADYTVMSVLLLLRAAYPLLRRAETRDFRLGTTPGRELRDLVVGVVGTGRIGTAVVARLRGFGCRVLTHDTRPRRGTDAVPLDELLRQSDVVTLHVPLTAETHHLLDRRRIGQLKPGAYVVNTARGALLDTGALVAALESGRLGGAALDVLEGEEGTFYADCTSRQVDPVLSRLLALPNVLVSPHTAFHTDHALRDIVENTLLGCLERGDRRG